MKERFKITPACYLILIRDGETLLLRRFNTGFQDGNYGLVAGHLDGDESFRDAMVREAQEEAGIVVDKEDLNIVHIMHRSKIDTTGERIDLFLTTEKWEGEIKNMEPEKCDELSWFPLNNLPANTIPYIREVLENIQNKKIYSEFGF